VGIRSPFLYQGLIREVIHHLKYKNLKVLAKPLGQLMAEYLSSNPLPADTLVPVPLHPKRIRQRGYNQSALLAREVGQILDLTVIEGSLIRSRNTASQVVLSAQERRSNVRQAFECKDQRLRGKQIILIDDICTTGSTLNACAVTLREIGAVSIWGLTLARET
jgi:ComF family protein